MMRSQLRTPPAGFASSDHADDLTGYSPYRSFPMPSAPQGRRNSASWQILAHETPMWFGIHGSKTFAKKLPRPGNDCGLIVAPTPSPEQLSIADRAMAMTSEDYRTPDLVARVQNCRSRAGVRPPGGSGLCTPGRGALDTWGGLRTPGRSMISRSQTPCTTARGTYSLDRRLSQMCRSATPSYGQCGSDRTGENGQMQMAKQWAKHKDPRLANFEAPRFPHLVRFAPNNLQCTVAL